MDLLFYYTQEKTDRKHKTLNVCDLKLHRNNELIEFTSYFNFDYNRYEVKQNITFQHGLVFNILNGDFTTSYRIINGGLIEDKLFRNTYRHKKNNFKMLFDLTEYGFDRGEKRYNYWGVKFTRAKEDLLKIFYNQIKDCFRSDFILEKLTKGEYTINHFYDMIVDLHLEMKGIKGHNGIYYDIQHEYPKKKWLIKNDYKFLPAVLDSYGIKSKYLIGELNKIEDKSINISSLNYLCKLFGNNYIDYLRRIKWYHHCYDSSPNKKTHELKNESEKNSLVSVINKWEKDTIKSDSLIYMLNKLFSIRELLEERGLNLKFKAKNDHEFENLLEIWSGFKIHLSRGYKMKYQLPDDVIDDLEEEFTIGDNVFKPKLILTEEDFRMEGYSMKNCMSKQFPHGAIYIFVSLQNKRKKINLQYRKGQLVQSYGKANTPVPELFNEATQFLTNKFKKYMNLEWKKEKYDFITR
jgi:hypothetical protein